MDVCIFAADGDAMDAASLAVYAALQDTRLPKLRTVAGETEEVLDIELEDEEDASVPVNMAGVPLLLTFSCTPTAAFIDATAQEAAVASHSVAIALDRGGRVHSMTCTGAEACPPATLAACVQTSKTLVPSLFARVDDALTARRAASGASTLSSGDAVASLFRTVLDGGAASNSIGAPFAAASSRAAV